MESREQSGSSSFWGRASAPTFVVLSAAIFAGALYKSKYDSPRPTANALEWDPAPRTERVEGLLTQDPADLAYRHFAGIYAEREAQVSKLKTRLDTHERCGVSLCVHVLGQRIEYVLANSRESSSRLLVLFESLRTGAYAEDREARVRARYATAAALTSMQFRATDPTHLSLLDWRPEWDANFGTDLAVGPKHPVVVPYEWYTRVEAPKANQYGDALVVWIDEGAADGRQASLVASLVSAILSSLNTAGSSSRLDFRWVGPTTSTALVELIEEVTDDDKWPSHLRDLLRHSRIEVFSPYATAPEEHFPGLSKLVPGNATGLEITRTIRTDDMLARLLVYELVQRVPALMTLNRREELPEWSQKVASLLGKLRFIKQSDEIIPIALIAEQDSTYGRAWAQNVSNAIAALKTAEPNKAERYPRLNQVVLKVFPFFSHMDGKMPLLAPEPSSGATSAKSDDNDYPIHAQQVDYLRRLEDELSAGEQPFAAIGVFGTDTYDKLMILEALRPKFPGATFFTTDLDARFLHPRHNAYTGNLVVASHFGLRDDSVGPVGLRDDSDGPGDAGTTYVLPEFRDSYQTAVFHSVRHLTQPSSKLASVQPRMYEIGRTEAVELNVRIEDTDVDESSPSSAPVGQAIPKPIAGRPPLIARIALTLIDWLPGTGVHAAGGDEDRKKEDREKNLQSRNDSVSALIGSCLILWVIGALATRPRNSADYGTPRRRPVLTFLLFVGVTVGLCMWIVDGVYDAADGYGDEPVYAAEPMDVTQGVSVWPTVLMRVAMTVFALFSLVSIQRKLRRAHLGIGEEFGLLPDSRLAGCKERLFDSVRESSGNRRGHRVPVWATEFLGWCGSVLKRHAVALAVLARRPVANPHPVPVADLWNRLEGWLRFRPVTFTRYFAYALIIYFILGAYFRLAEPAPSPARGPYAFILDRATLFANLISYFALIGAVIEATFVAARLVAQVVDPKATALTGSGVRSDLPVACHEHLDRRSRLLLARAITQQVETLMYLPAVVFGVMILSRASIFDSWSWPPVLIVVLVLIFVLLFLCVWSMRRVAKSAKQDTLEFLYGERVVHAAEDAVMRPLGWVVVEIESLRGGAFSPLLENPFVRAALLPLAAFGTTLAIEREFFMTVLANF